MNAEQIRSYVLERFADVLTTEDGDNIFFFTDPRKYFSFVTLVANNAYDQYSDLDRSGVYRLNIGVRKATFQAMFPDGIRDQEFDYTQLGVFMPHPEYGKMYWLSILNPDDALFSREVAPLLDEAYALSLERFGSVADQAKQPEA